MKNIFRKNQVIITALAVMIAVAGYLNYSGSKVNTEDLAKETAGEAAGTDLADLSDEDLLALDTNEDIESNDVDLENDDADSKETSSETPGEAVLTGTEVQGIVAQAKLSREQVRAKNKESMLEIINNDNVTEEQKQNAIDTMISMTDIAEKEVAAETLLQAKGFTDVVVNISGDSADVVVDIADLDDTKRAQIEDIMKRKTGVAAENIVITPVNAAASDAE